MPSLPRPSALRPSTPRPAGTPAGPIAHNLRWRRRKVRFEARTGVARSGDTFRLTEASTSIGIRFKGRPPSGWVSFRFDAGVEGLASVAAHILVERNNGAIERIQLRTQPAGRCRDVVLLPADTLRLRLGLDLPGVLTAKNPLISELGEVWLGAETVGLATKAAASQPTAARTELKRAMLDGNDAQTIKHAALNVARGQLDRSYETWVRQHDTVTSADIARLKNTARAWTNAANITALVDSRGASATQLGHTIRSIMNQANPHWQVRVLVDSTSGETSTGPSGAANTVELLVARAQLVDDRVALDDGRLPETTTHVTYIAAGDLLSPLAFYLLGADAMGNPEAQLIYSDEDEVDSDGTRHRPFMKPRWDPDLLDSHDFTSRLSLWRIDAFPTNRTDLSWQTLYEATQSARANTMLTAASRDLLVRHVPFVAYHRATESQAGLPKTALSATSSTVANSSAVDQPRVSVIVCTRDQPQHLRTALAGLLDDTDYLNLEVIIVDNGTVDEAALAELARRDFDERVKIVTHDAPFNFSELNNLGAAHASGSVLALINNDIQVIEPGWLQAMVRQAQRNEVGAVGCRLDYPDGTLQHAGVVVGMGGVAGHVSKHRVAHEDSSGRSTSRRQVSAVTAAAMVLRKDVFDSVHGLDEANLAVAFNDIDLCLRIRKLGLIILYEPAARLIHHESVSRGPDTNPVAAQRFAKEIAYMREHWYAELTTEDPFHSPNLAIDREDGSLAFPPRTKLP